ncbi:MAG: hypothetical protein IPK16_15635 [Anaerolineales bacterium]|nr:hypothetical protein [Anaerolineales bacterium]
MSEPRVRALLWATFLVAGGVVLLLFNLGVLAPYTPIPQIALAAVCVAGAIFFFAGFARNGREWWRLIPAWTLVALAAMFLVTILPVASPQLVAALLFAGLALAFAHIYWLDRRERWWAIIPGGFLLVLGVVIWLNSQTTSPTVTASVLFTGLGLVFFLLYLLDRRRQWWALLPGSVLVVFGVLALTTGNLEANPIVPWWPVLLILAGIFVGVSSGRKPVTADKLRVESAPKVASRSAAAGTGKPSTGAAPRGVLGEYSQPVPGATVEILPEHEE